MVNLMKFKTDKDGHITIVNEDELSLEPNSRYSAIVSLPIPDGYKVESPLSSKMLKHMSLGVWPQ